MPRLVFSGIKEETCKAISKNLIDTLQAIVECPRDYFTIEVNNPLYISDGKTVPAPAMIQVYWFDRGTQTRDAVAAAITKIIQEAECQTVTVIFNTIKPDEYFENGEHF